jgi:uncharacterized LabA/DUF88 family protein
MKQARAIIFIDGSNLYFKLRDLKLHQLLSFDFSKFASFLARKDSIVMATYYVGAVRTDGSEKTTTMLANQQRLFAHLKKHKVRYSLGYLLKSGGVFHEKGVDVHIAVDMLVAAYENLADSIYLVSSDTDLIPAVKKAQEKGKMVIYVGFSHQLSTAMVANCRETRTLTRDDLLPFIQEKKHSSRKAA